MKNTVCLGFTQLVTLMIFPTSQQTDTTFCRIDEIALVRSLVALMEKMHRVAPPWLRVVLWGFPHCLYSCQHAWIYQRCRNVKWAAESVFKVSYQNLNSNTLRGTPARGRGGLVQTLLTAFPGHIPGEHIQDTFSVWIHETGVVEARYFIISMLWWESNR